LELEIRVAEHTFARADFPGRGGGAGCGGGGFGGAYGMFLLRAERRILWRFGAESARRGAGMADGALSGVGGSGGLSGFRIFSALVSRDAAFEGGGHCVADR